MGNPKPKTGVSQASRPRSVKSNKQPVATVSEVDGIDEKYAMDDLQEDIEHGVAHPVSAMAELEERVNDLDNAWESESLLADMLEGLSDESVTNDPEYCTPEEAVSYRQLLRTLGPEELINRTITSGLITAKKLLSAFDVRPPGLDGQPDSVYFDLLILAFSRELSKRAKLQQYNSVDDAVALLKKSKNIIVLTGAGISTSLGIPDFRSKGTGLYSKLEHLGLNDPQEVFDISLFKQDPSIFFSVARDIMVETERFSPTHAFIALLQKHGKLLTNYSQNIDNLESKAGIDHDKLIQCHGSFATATCFTCYHQVPGDDILPDIKAGKIPRCPKCGIPRRGTKNSRKRKLAKDGTSSRPRRRPGDYDSASDSEYDMPSKGGIMKPDITFFGEALPDEFSSRLVDHDRDKTDLVVVIGTSLKVAPVSELVPFLYPHIPQIYISRTPVNHHNFDIDLLGDCDVVVAELCRRAGWDLRHEMVPENQVVDVVTESGWSSRHIFTERRPADTGDNHNGSPAAAAAATASTSENTSSTAATPRSDDNDLAEKSTRPRRAARTALPTKAPGSLAASAEGPSLASRTRKSRASEDDDADYTGN
ncbi:putative sir2-like protein [Diaporthe ampelina]|uniref:Putative sir2-like protein n=1 Tax=Diaporthe ampelina TaxID=1214573 RepID=A0A0G2FLK9_9PEZI|nr:putative sir2-like protein [Diaporthe ampelina]